MGNANENALTLGLFPECELGKAYDIGDAAGEGARIAPINIDKRQEAEETIKKIEYIELSAETDFQNVFVDALQFSR